MTNFGHLILPWMNGQDISTLVTAFVAKEIYSPSLFQVTTCLANLCMCACAVVVVVMCVWGGVGLCLLVQLSPLA